MCENIRGTNREFLVMIDLFCNRENLPMCNLTFDIVDRKYDDSAKCWNLSFRADGGLYGIVGFGATIPDRKSVV